MRYINPRFTYLLYLHAQIHDFYNSGSYFPGNILL